MTEKARGALVAAALVSLTACDPIEEITSIACGDEYQVATLRHLPPKPFYGTCDGFVCKPEQEAGMHAWADDIRRLADRQADRCVAAAYRSWAVFYDLQTVENAAHWRGEQRARKIEETMAK